MTLPPGQRAADGFPRFGTHLSRPAPAAPADPVLAITGLVPAAEVPLTALAALPRREITADFHCVAGWSATGLRWAGVPFATFYQTYVAPARPAGTPVTHLVFRGLDGHRSVVTIDDALAADVLLADHLDGRPLGSDHGAPLRLVSPGQYGYVNVKHLCRIGVHGSEPRSVHLSLPMRLLSPHPRARVWQEERHRHLPSWSIRRIYRATVGPTARLCARGGEDAGR